MRFRMVTLIDITETGARRSDSEISFGQQSNYNTVIQTIGLRANPIPVQLKDITSDLTEYQFGDKLSGSHKIWIFDFNIEYRDVISVQGLVDDFNLIPITSGLTETIEINNFVFDTVSKNFRNTFFINLDK